MQERGGRGALRSSVTHDELEGVDASLHGGAQRAHDPPLCHRSAPRTVTAPDLSVHDRRADRLRVAPVGGVDVGVRKGGFAAWMAVSLGRP